MSDAFFLEQQLNAVLMETIENLNTQIADLKRKASS